MPDEWEVQTRDTKGELLYFETIKEALNHANANPDVWKISMSLPSGERLRLVRSSLNFYVDQLILPNDD